MDTRLIERIACDIWRHVMRSKTPDEFNDRQTIADINGGHLFGHWLVKVGALHIHFQIGSLPMPSHPDENITMIAGYIRHV